MCLADFHKCARRGPSPASDGAIMVMTSMMWGSPDEAAPKYEIFQVGWFRKVVLSFLLLLMLPFYISLGPMLIARISHEFPVGTWGLLLIAVAMTIVLTLILFQLVYAVRAKVELGEKAFRTVLPRRGLSPRLQFERRELAYEDVRAVEFRREVYGAPLAPVLLLGTRIIPREGPPIVLGYVNEKNIDPVFPHPDIAREIARRANISVTNVGNVRRLAPRRVLAFADPYARSDTIADEELGALERRHDRLVRYLVAALFALLIAGIAIDVMSERGQMSGQGTPAPATKPAKK